MSTATSINGTTPTAHAAPIARCELCGCRIHTGTGDDMVRKRCRDHKNTPAPAAAKARATRPFTAADKALIKSLRAFPQRQLLDILNSRLVADVGDQCAPYTLEQLTAELGALEPEASAAGDWSSLRRLIASARRSGLLKGITPQVIDDFAVVFSLTPAQHMRVRDIVRDAQEVA